MGGEQHHGIGFSAASLVLAIATHAGDSDNLSEAAAERSNMCLMVQFRDMRLVQRADGSLVLVHNRLAEPLPIPRDQLERWLVRLVRQSLTPLPLPVIAEKAAA